MGICLSSSSRIDGGKLIPAAIVISADGELRRHAVPVTVSQVLETELQSAVPSPSKLFVCNSDRLYYDEYIAALDLDYELQAHQIYFVLPVSKLRYKLSASDMAALAVKASLALQKYSSSDSTKRAFLLRRCSRYGKESKYVRIAPVTEKNGFSNEKTVNQRYSPLMKQSTAGMGDWRSGSVRLLQRYSSRRGNLGGGSFRTKLITIYEDYVV